MQRVLIMQCFIRNVPPRRAVSVHRGGGPVERVRRADGRRPGGGQTPAVCLRMPGLLPTTLRTLGKGNRRFGKLDIYAATKIHSILCRHCLVYYTVYFCTRRNAEFPKSSIAPYVLIWTCLCCVFKCCSKCSTHVDTGSHPRIYPGRLVLCHVPLMCAIT